MQYILDTVIPELEKDPNKRFVYVEMGNFIIYFLNVIHFFQFKFLIKHFSGDGGMNKMKK